MSEPISLTLTIHGLVDFDDQVDGEVWAEKFSAFMKGLAAADAAANGERLHKFIVADLRKNTATAQIAEYQYKTHVGGKSSCDYYRRAIDLIRHDAPMARQLPQELVQSIVTLSRGASRSFEFGEIKGDDNVIYLNPVLFTSAERVLRDIKARDEGAIHFEGQAYGSFDGVLRLADYQHNKKRGMIYLTAGEVAVPCDLSSVNVDEVSAVLTRRAVFYGLARYTPTNPLPDLVEVKRIEQIVSSGSLADWRGTFGVVSDDEEDDSWGDQ